MLNKTDLLRLIDEAGATGDPENIEPELTAWGIDCDEFIEIMIMVSERALSGVVNGQSVPIKALGATFYLAFSLGMKTAMELEMRRAVKG